jgi:hypothetical protein
MCQETTVSQQMLQDRVERLERIIEDMTSASTPSIPISKFSQRNSAYAPSPFISSDTTANTSAATGSQVSKNGSSYYISPDHCINLENMTYEPRYMLDITADDWVTPTTDWPLSLVMGKLKETLHLHLATNKEDVLLQLFLDHVEPFVRIIHHEYLWWIVSDFRQGSSTCSMEVEALMFSAQYIAASVLPANLIQDKVGVEAAELRLYLQWATEAALERANVMQSRNMILFCALLFYIVSLTDPFHQHSFFFLSFFPFFFFFFEKVEGVLSRFSSLLLSRHFFC